MRKVEVFFSTALPVFAAFLAFLVWKARYPTGPLGFRGVGLGADSGEGYINLATFCNNLPMCFRPFAGWIILGVEKVIVVPIQLVLSVIYPNTIFLDKLAPITAVSISATFVIGLCCMASFYFLWKAFPGIYGFLAWFSLLIMPIVNSVVGLVLYDAIILCFWSIVLSYSIQYLPGYFDESIVGWKNYRETILSSCLDWRSLSLSGFMVGFTGSFIMENTGVAFCIGSLFLFISGRFFGYKFPTFGFVFSSGLGILLAFAISWTLTHRHDDVFWVTSGHGIERVWAVYGHQNSFSDIESKVVHMMRPGMKIGAMIFVLSLIFGDLLGKVDVKRIFITLFTSCSFFLGFGSTVLVGRYTAGFHDEYTRELLPAAYFSSFIFPALGLLAGFWMRNLIVSGINKKRTKVDDFPADF